MLETLDGVPMKPNMSGPVEPKYVEPEGRLLGRWGRSPQEFRQFLPIWGPGGDNDDDTETADPGQPPPRPGRKYLVRIPPHFGFSYCRLPVPGECKTADHIGLRKILVLPFGSRLAAR